MRGSTPWKAWHGRLAGMATFVLLWLVAPAAAEKTDVVIMDNGDHVTGEVKKLSRGLLELSTDHLGTVQVEWSHIDKLTSKSQFVVELENGQRFVGTVQPAAGKGQLEIVGMVTETVDLPSVVEMAPQKRSFWDQVDGSANLGFSFSQSNTVTTWTGSANANYLTRHYLTAVTFSSYFNNQERTDSTTRNTLGLTLSRFFGEKWFFLGLSQFLQSDELGLDLRTTLGGALGRRLIHTNRSILSPAAGFVYSNSGFTSPTPTRNEVMAIAGLQYSLFNYEGHKTNLTTSFYVLPSLTESGHVRLDLNSQFSVKLFSNFYWSVNLYEEFDNRPPPGGSRNDFGVSTSLGWSF